MPVINTRSSLSALACLLAAGLAVSSFTATGALAKPAADKPAADKPAAKAAEKPEAKKEASGTLSVGDKAPELKVSKFVKGKPVTGFEKGQTYVVEFWATWCGPCKATIPHLTKLQKEHGSKVTMIGVSVWEQDQSKVEPFVKEMGEKMDYAVAMDDMGTEKGFMAANWMQAAKQNGIPAAFIVDGTGTIAWIGHPMGMDKPLAQIIEGKFDIKAAAEEAKAEAAKEAARDKEMEANQKTFAALDKAMRRKNFDEALKLVDELQTKAPSMKAQLAGAKTNIRMAQFKSLLTSKKETEAYKIASELVDGDVKDNAMGLNEIAWTILDEEGVGQRDLDLAMKVAVKANELTKGADGMILDTLARAHFEKGDITKAVELQQKAIEKSAGNADMVEQMTEALEKYKKAAAKK
jgi:thiol-disulfide isomerase/thioredoxin